MSDIATMPPARRPDLVVSPLGDNGQHVVKDPATGAYFQLGEQEAFLLARLDGSHSAEQICAAFEERFGQPLTKEELGEFIEMARTQGFLQPAGPPSSSLDEVAVRSRSGTPDPAPAQAKPAKPHQSILFWRKQLFDPDRLFDWLQPKIWFFWTTPFLVFSLACIASATVLVIFNRQELITRFGDALRWETAVMAAGTLLVVTILHEFAHGLTCKRYGGKVHEIGFLAIFLMPALYCNVSDAWLFRERSKRLWVTLAGGYFELCLWSLAVFVWRLSFEDSLLNYLAWIVLTVSGTRVFFNFNPFIKLDGYYLLSDWMEIPNLRDRALSRVAGHVRWLFWGAPRPAPDPRGKFLLGYGLASWLFSVVFLLLMLWGFTTFLWDKLGWVGLVLVVLLGGMTMRGLFQGFSAGQFSQMLLVRRKRTVLWLTVLAGVVAVLCIPIQDRASGPFRVRPLTRVELRAPVAGFLQDIPFDEGDRVSPGSPVARIDIPELPSRIAQKQAELKEADAKLQLLLIGPRPLEIEEQKARVDRAKTWRDLAGRDLKHQQQVLVEELDQLGKQISQCKIELDSAQESYNRAKPLRAKGAVAEEDLRDLERKSRLAQALWEESQSKKRAREIRGVVEAETELARRDKDWADAQSVLTLLQAGTRPEEIAAQRALLSRLTEEAGYLAQLQQKTVVSSTVAGLITTAHLKERVGQYVREGDLICMIEEPAVLEAEIALPEQEVARIKPGDPVELKSRALPYETFTTKVDQIAPSAAHGDVQSTLIVHCRLEGPCCDLRPGMSGHARIYVGSRPIGLILMDRGLRFVRTEFWW